MGRHFRTSDDAQVAPQQPSSANDAPQVEPSSAAEAASPDQLQSDLFSVPAAGDAAAPGADDDAAAGGAHRRSGDPFANIPSPADPAAPQTVPTDLFMTAEGPATISGEDERRQLAELDAALQNPGFTTVFAPVDAPEPSAQREAGVEPVILMEHLTKIYPAQPNKPALDDVNLEIYPGEFVFLVGHSGSGKSTMLNTIIRDVKPTSGRILVAGQDLTKIRNRKVPYLRRQIGTVFQDYKLLPNKTVYENVAFALQCIGKPRAVVRAQVPEVLRLVGLGDRMDSFPDELSGGEQQRVSVARAMVNRPPLLVCDEPTGNLDPAISLGIMKLLDRINRTGTTVLVATHDREMVDSMHRRVIALEGGRVVRDQERGGYGNYGSY